MNSEISVYTTTAMKCTTGCYYPKVVDATNFDCSAATWQPATWQGSPETPCRGDPDHS